MAALWTKVTDGLPTLLAYSKANRLIRSLAVRVISLMLCMTPGKTSCSMPEYSPSVFSRIIKVSTPSYTVFTPSMLRHGRTLAYNWNALLRLRLRLTWPVPMGVAKGPFKPIPVSRRRAMVSGGIPIRPSGSLVGVTGTMSQVMGTFAALKTFCTASEISGPMPSPGMRLTVRTALLLLGPMDPVGVLLCKWHLVWCGLLVSTTGVVLNDEWLDVPFVE